MTSFCVWKIFVGTTLSLYHINRLISAHTYLIFIAAIDYETILQQNYSIMQSCDHSNFKIQFLTEYNC